VLKGAAKKLIPGAAYVEAALLAGAKPTFGGEGMSAEEALLEIAKTGTPPDMEMSDELQELLKANPDVLERLRAVAGGKATSDEAAQAMIDMLEANMDLLDAETLEGIAKMAESSDDPRLAKTAAEVRKTLEAIKAGKIPERGGGEAESEAEGEAEAEVAAEAGVEATEKKEGEKKAAGLKLPEDFKKTLKDRKPLADLFDEVLDRSKKGEFNEGELKRFRAAVEGLKEDHIKQILEEVAKLPSVEAETKEPKQKVLDVVVDLAAKLAAGEKAPAEAEANVPEGVQDAEAGKGAAAAEIEITRERQLWINRAIDNVIKSKFVIVVQIALSTKTIKEIVRGAKQGETDMAHLPGAFAVDPKGGVPALGAFVTLKPLTLHGKTLKVSVVASSAVVNKAGKVFSGNPLGTEATIKTP
jgi:hypothetical protein